MSKWTKKKIEKVASQYNLFGRNDWGDGWKTSIRTDGRVEYTCEHGVGHGGVHGCDRCCSRDSFPITNGAPDSLTDDLITWHRAVVCATVLRRITQSVSQSVESV